MGSIVFPAARVLVAWLEQHGGNLDGVRALGKGEIQCLIFNFQYSILDGEKQFEWGMCAWQCLTCMLGIQITVNNSN